MNVKIQIPPAFSEIIEPARYKVFYGGRGAGKSWAIAAYLIVKSLQGNYRILCARELQNSIRDSVHKLLKDTITRYGLDDYFQIQERAIVSASGSEFLFFGLRNNPDAVQSKEGIDILWIEEGQSISAGSIEKTFPTIRKENSEIIISFNPRFASDPVYSAFVACEELPPRTIVRKINYTENPHFPDVLKEQLEYMRKTDFERYRHVWEGELLEHSEAAVFAKKYIVDDFEAPENIQHYYGLDFGFSADPCALSDCYIVGNNLYIYNERYEHGVDIDRIPAWIEKIVKNNREVKADASRPDTISYCRRHGINMRGANKMRIDDGLAYLRSFEKIVIHQRCKNAIYEFENYSYKIDKHTGKPTTELEDKNNHFIDSIRYALDNNIAQPKNTLQAASFRLP